MGAPLIAAGIAAGGQLLGTGINALAQGSINRKTQKWNEKMHNLQRQESLADYAMQNAYNHPSAQMARLRESGLNPNLVYGNGATTESAKPAASPVGSWNPRAPEYDLGSAASSGIAAYQNTKMQEAQIDNLRVQNDVLQKDALLKQAQTIGTLASADKTKMDTNTAAFDLALKEAIKSFSIDAARLGVEQAAANVQYTLDQNERAKVMQAATLGKMIEEVAAIKIGRAKTNAEINQIKESIENMKKEGKLKDLELELRKKGINPNDPTWLRMIAQGISSVEIGSPGESIVDAIKKKYGIK